MSSSNQPIQYALATLRPNIGANAPTLKDIMAGQVPKRKRSDQKKTKIPTKKLVTDQVLISHNIRKLIT